jgi:rod shape determining protein RodA
MTPLLRKLLGMNWLLFGLMVALSIFGVIAIYSCTYMREDVVYATMWKRQSVWLGIGIVTFFVVSLLDYRWVKWGAMPMYLVSIVFLILTLVMGLKLEGARSWLKLGPIQFQPAQLAVLSGILVMGLFLSQFRAAHPALKVLAVGAIAGAPALLILLQPDFGSCMIWGPVVFAMLYVARIPKRYLIVIALLGAIAMPIGYHFKLKDYQQKRIIAFIDPDIDPQGAGWAINQTLVAVGSGGWAGKGFKAPNSQVELGFVPRTTVPSDYIFTPIGEQWGFLGGVALVGAFGALLASGLFVAFNAGDELGLMLVVGVCALIFTHTFQNIGMTISIMPITGVPLPLISFGGSFAVVIMFGLGLVNSVWIHRKAIGD